jgi:outer membrane protein TolC
MTMLTTLFQVLLRNVSRSAVRIVAAVLIMAVAGCTVGPDFEAPKPPSVTRYTSPGEATVPGPDATKAVPTQAIALGARVAANWWTLFRSPKLDLLVKQAIAGNLTLESAKARLAEAREAIAVATSALYPQIGLNAGATEQKQSADAFGLTPNVAPLPSSFNLFQVGPTASYTPDLFGQTHRRIEQQVALAEYQSDQLDVAYLTLTGNTVSQALRAAAARSQLKALNDILDIDRQNVELVRKQRQAGTVPDSDVIVAESQLAADETMQPGLEQQLKLSRARADGSHRSCAG